MSHLPKIAAALVAAGLLLPAGAFAEQLGSQATLHDIDSHHAQLEFAAPSAPDHIVVGAGRHLSTLRTDGYHGYDHRYVATFTSQHALRVGTKYTITFTYDGSKPQTQHVMLHAAS